MTNTNKYTNATALETAIALLNGESVPMTPEDRVDLIAKLTKMHTVAAKPRKKSNTPTKEQLATMNMAKELVAAMREPNAPEVIGTDWVMAHVQYVTSPQKATAVLRIAIANGEVEKTEPEKGKTRYQLVR